MAGLGFSNRSSLGVVDRVFFSDKRDKSGPIHRQARRQSQIPHQPLTSVSEVDESDGYPLPPLLPNQQPKQVCKPWGIPGEWRVGSQSLAVRRCTDLLLNWSYSISSTSIFWRLTIRPSGSAVATGSPPLNPGNDFGLEDVLPGEDYFGFLDLRTGWSCTGQRPGRHTQHLHVATSNVEWWCSVRPRSSGFQASGWRRSSAFSRFLNRS